MSARAQRRLQTLTCAFWLVTALSCTTLLFHRSTAVRVLRSGLQLWVGPKEAPLVTLADLEDGLASAPSQRGSGKKKRAKAPTKPDAAHVPVQPLAAAAGGGEPAVWASPAAAGSFAAAAAAAELEVPPDKKAAEPAAAPRYRAKYGFYIHAYHSPAAVIYQVRELKKHFPVSPVHLMTDGGLRFDGLCAAENCTFVHCPPANDRWHPWPFMRRLYDAAVSLNTEYVIMLEPDNTIHGPITRPPTHDAGGLRVPGRRIGYSEYAEKLAQKFKPGFKWRGESMEAGLCGGSYYRTAMLLDAFSDEAVAAIDWNHLGEKASKEVFSSDFAMPYIIAARGYEAQPWDDATQMHTPDKLAHGLPDAAFKHYGSVKPTYQMQLKPRDGKLFKEPPSKYNQFNSNCQVCYDLKTYKVRVQKHT